MRFASLGSGSQGNATLIDRDGFYILIDCGFSGPEIERRMAPLGVCPSELAAVLITHEHSDHMRGVAGLQRRLGLPVYATAGTARAIRNPRGVEVVDSHRDFDVGPLRVRPVPVPHDAAEPVQYIVSDGALRLGVLTDLGAITPHVQEQYRECDALLVEANHDLEMLHNGPYPPSLKRRVASGWGHLNNGQTADFLQGVERSRLRQLLIGHISLKNNLTQLVRDTVADAVAPVANVNYASQEESTGWLHLDC